MTFIVRWLTLKTTCFDIPAKKFNFIFPLLVGGDVGPMSHFCVSGHKLQS